MSMKRKSKLIISILGMLLLASCTTAPLTGRKQLKLVKIRKQLMMLWWQMF